MMTMSEDTALPMPAELRNEIDRIKRAMEPSDDDREDLITYAREVVALRERRG